MSSRKDREREFRYYQGKAKSHYAPEVDYAIRRALVHFHFLTDIDEDTGKPYYTADQVCAELDTRRRFTEFRTAVEVLPREHLERIRAEFDTLPSWHTMTEPARWVKAGRAPLGVVLDAWWAARGRGGVVNFDLLRRQFGYSGTQHRPGEDNPDQGTLGV